MLLNLHSWSKKITFWYYNIRTDKQVKRYRYAVKFGLNLSRRQWRQQPHRPGHGGQGGWHYPAYGEKIAAGTCGGLQGPRLRLCAGQAPFLAQLPCPTKGGDAGAGLVEIQSSNNHHLFCALPLRNNSQHLGRVVAGPVAGGGGWPHLYFPLNIHLFLILVP